MTLKKVFLSKFYQIFYKIFQTFSQKNLAVLRHSTNTDRRVTAGPNVIKRFKSVIYEARALVPAQPGLMFAGKIKSLP